MMNSITICSSKLSRSTVSRIRSTVKSVRVIMQEVEMAVMREVKHSKMKLYRSEFNNAMRNM
eukprot:scaffold83557_cov89-Cyclotella_meneghiniana.AAC.1